MAQIDSLELKIQSNFSTVISEIDKCIGKINDVENKIKNFGQTKSLDSLANKTKEIQSNMENVGKKITDSTSKINQQMKPAILSLEQIQQKYKDLGKGYQFHGSTEQIEKEIAKLSNSLEKAKLRKTELESTGKTKGKMFEYAVKDVIKFQNQIDSLRNKINSLSNVKVEIPIQRWYDNTGSSKEQQTETGTAKFHQYDQQAIMDFVNNFGAKVETLGDKLSKLVIPEIREENLEKLNRAIEKTETKLEELRVKLANGLTMGSITESEDDSKYVRLQEQIALTEKTLEALQSKKMQVESSSGGGGLEQLQSRLSGITSVGARVNSALSKVRFAVSNVAKGFASGVSKVASFTKELLKSKKASNGFSSSLGGGFKNVLKYAFGIRSLYMLFNKMRRAIKEGFNNLVQYSSETNASVSLLKNSMTQLKNASASMIAPLLNAFAPALNQIIQLCVKAANSVNQLLSALTGQSTWTKAKTLTDDYASSLNNASKAAKGSTRAFDELKVINSNSDSGSSGTSASDMFETVEIENKFKDLASKIQSGFVEPIKKIISDFKVGDYFQAGQDVSNLVISINDFFARAIDNVDWYGIGTKIGDFLAGVDWIDVLSSIGRLIWEAINAGIELWKGSFETAPIETVIIGLLASPAIIGFGSKIGKFIVPPIVNAWGIIEPILSTAASMINPITLAIAALAVGLGVAYAKNEEVRESFANVTQAIKEGFQPAVESITNTLLPDLQAGWERLKEILSPFTDFLNDTFVSIWQDMINPKLSYLGTDILPDVTSVFENLWNKVLVPFGNFLADVLTPVIQIVSDILSILWKNVVVPLADFIGGIFATVWKNLVDILNKTVIPIANKVIQVFQFLWNYVFSPLINFLWSVLKPAFEAVFGAIGGIITSLKDIFSGIINFIVGIFTGDLGKALDGIKSIFKGVFNGIASIIEGGVNLVINGLNGLIKGVNKVTGVIGDAIGINLKVSEIGKISIPRLETGGLVMKHTFAEIGEYGKKEAVLPLENKRTMSLIADSITENMDGGYGSSDMKDVIYSATYNAVYDAMSKNRSSDIQVQANITMDGEPIYSKMLKKAREDCSANRQKRFVLAEELY